MAEPALKSILSNITHSLQKLEQTLADEFTALSNDDFEQIQQTAQDKNTVFETLEKLEQQRQQHLADAGLDLNSTGVMAYLDRQTANIKSEMSQSWEQIEVLTQHCRQQNAVNGIILEKNRRRIEKALSILKGQITDTHATYSANGKATSTQTSHTFAKA
ncbi:MAG: flagellar protein FlgN [Gammaproteobacteria bacterium]|nr:flagellar protein FlgN [Gammaproteobacteria bacterium]